MNGKVKKILALAAAGIMCLGTVSLSFAGEAGEGAAVAGKTVEAATEKSAEAASEKSVEAAEATQEIAAEAATDNSTGAVKVKTAKDGRPTVAYIPLDNRPVNVQRVVYEAESAGFKVIMPDEDLYATRLDGQPLNSNGKPYGDTDGLYQWLLEADKETDYFVISLDQLLSGGLVNSRNIDNTNITKECVVMDKLVALSKENKIYIVDTIPRLSTCTVGYDSTDAETYNYLRYYAIYPRNILSDINLTFRNVVDSYRRDYAGRLVDIPKQFTRAVGASLRVRERKLSLINYLLSMDSGHRMKYFVGIDDSSSEATIQTNEINFLTKRIGDRGMIYSGTDEVGMMAMMKLMSDHYKQSTTAYVKYIGGTQSKDTGTKYDRDFIDKNISLHLKSIGVNELKSPEGADVQIIALVKPKEEEKKQDYLELALKSINYNIEKNIPTIVINTAPGAYGGQLESRMVNECEMGMLLSYSCWGTTGNAIGIALGNGFARYMYIENQNSSSNQADEAFLKGLIFSYAKDISYIRGGGKTLFTNYLKSKGFSESNFYRDEKSAKEAEETLEKLMMEGEYSIPVTKIIANMTGRRYIKGLAGESGIIEGISISNFTAPFYRNYEIRFDISPKVRAVTMEKTREVVSDSTVFLPKEGNMIYDISAYTMDEQGVVHKVESSYDRKTGVLSVKLEEPDYIYIHHSQIPVATAQAMFADISPNSWFADSAVYVVKNGIMSTDEKGNFRKGDLLTKEELKRAFEAMDENAAERLYAGADDVLRPSLTGDGAISRKELARCMYEFSKLRGKGSRGICQGVTGYADVFAVGADYREAMDWACSHGIITGGGKDGTLVQPDKTVNRTEAAVMLKRLAVI